MDFSLTDEQDAVRDLAEQVLSDRVTPDRLRQVEAADDWFDRDLWQALADAGLVGIALPERHGGGALGIIEACLVAEQIGRRVAPVPYLHSTTAAMTLARFATDEQQRRWLPGAATGERIFTLALHEPGDAGIPEVPATTATPEGDGWRLEGEKSAVPAVHLADVVLVPAQAADRATIMFVVDAEAPGSRRSRGVAVTGEPQWTLELDGVVAAPESVVGDPADGSDVLTHAADHLMALVCAAQTGVCEEALALTARHVAEREQFGAKLGTFQAVAQRMADAYIDTEGVRLTALQAAWRLSADLEASDELLVAKYWAAEGAQRVVHAAQHLHGGIGVDIDHPIHRYFRWAKVMELTLGGASPTLRRLGAELASRRAAT
jgi:3-oxocholest-4-en-26-oyl-CoA dehydrogenase beta subunit